MQLSNERVPLKTKILYGAGDLTTSLLTTILTFNVIFFLTKVVGLDAGLIAITIFIGRGFDWINDPIIGHISDRTRSRWGRRRPFLLFGLVPLALTFIFFFWIPPWENHVALAVYYGIMYMLLDTAATIVYMPYYALTPELTLDYDERTGLNTARMVFSILGGLLAVVLPDELIKLSSDPRQGYFTMAIIIGLVGSLPLLLTFFGTRERPENQAQSQPGLRESLAAFRDNRPFQIALVIFALTWTTIDLMSAILKFFVYDWLQKGDSFALIGGTLFISAIFFLPLWDWISGRWNKTTAYIAGMAFFVLTMGTLALVQPSTTLLIVCVVAAVAGIGVAAAHVIPWAILPDAIEWDELRTGTRHEGMFYSMVTLAQKIASWLVLSSVPLIMAQTGYISEASIQPESALQGIRGMVVILPAILLSMGIIFALRYPLSRKEHAEIRAKLAARRAAANPD